MKTYKLIIILTVWTLVCSGICAGQTMATLTLPDTSGAPGNTVAIPITVSTGSTIGLAQFVVEFDSTSIKFHNAIIGKDISNFVVSLTNSNLPFATAASGTNENVLVQISGGGAGSFSGHGKKVVALNFIVVNSSGKSSLIFDQASNHTSLTTTELTDITGEKIEFINGSISSTTGVETGDSHVSPSSFTLHQNYPNPFNPVTQIRYELPKDSDVKLWISNMLGQEITTLVDKHHDAGVYSVNWNGKDKNGDRVPSGIYFYRMETAGFVQTKRMILLQ